MNGITQFQCVSSLTKIFCILAKYLYLSLFFRMSLAVLLVSTVVQLLADLHASTTVTECIIMDKHIFHFHLQKLS